MTRKGGAGHRGAIGKPHRCSLCRHPGGVNRRLGEKKRYCDCACHRLAVTQAAPEAA